MRVLHIVEATAGGVARHVVDLCAGLAQRGIEIHVAYSPIRMDPIFKAGLSNLREAGVKLFELPMRRAPHPSDLWVLWLLRRYLVEQGPFTLMHGHSSKGGGLARLLRPLVGARVVYTPHGFITLSPHILPSERQGYGLIERGLVLFTDALVANSEYEAKEAQHLGYPSAKVYVIPNGIRVDEAKASEEEKESLRQGWGLEKNHLVVGFVGRFVTEKGPEVLLEAFSRVAPKHPLARLVMVGEGPLREQLREGARRLGLEGRVVWPGFVNGQEAMRVFDIFVLPSDYESFGYVLIEAMAEGLPVIATEVGIASEAIQEGENGFLVQPRDVQALVVHLDTLLSDPLLRKRMGESSRARVQQFSVDKMIEATLGLYREIVKRS